MCETLGFSQETIKFHLYRERFYMLSNMMYIGQVFRLQSIHKRIFSLQDEKGRAVMPVRSQQDRKIAKSR
jgi:hypothetical protein